MRATSCSELSSIDRCLSFILISQFFPVLRIINMLFTLFEFFLYYVFYHHYRTRKRSLTVHCYVISHSLKYTLSPLKLFNHYTETPCINIYLFEFYSKIATCLCLDYITSWFEFRTSYNKILLIFLNSFLLSS